MLPQRPCKLIKRTATCAYKQKPKRSGCWIFRVISGFLFCGFYNMISSLRHDISAKNKLDVKMNLGDPNPLTYYPTEQYQSSPYRHAYSSTGGPPPSIPNINQSNGQPQYPNSGAYYQNQVYSQPPLPPMNHVRPPISAQDHNTMTPQRPLYPATSQYPNPSEVQLRRETPYQVQNEQPAMHYQATQNTNNNHMLNQAPHPPFNSPKMASALPPGSMVGGHCINGPWPNNNQYGTSFPTSGMKSLQSPSSFSENQNTSSSAEGDSSVSQPTPNKRSYPCPKCSKVFKRGDHLKRHLLSVHDREHPYQCGECSKGFASVNTLTRHCQASHPGISTKGHLCVRCELRYRSITELEGHAVSLHLAQDAEYMKNINKSSKTFQCEICHKTVSSEKNLKRHIKKLHGENAKNILSCAICEQSFISNESLKEHMCRAHASSSVTPAIENSTPVMTEPTVIQSPMVNKTNMPLDHERQFATKPNAVPTSIQRMSKEMPQQHLVDQKPMNLPQPVYQQPDRNSMKTMLECATDPYQQPASDAGQVASNAPLPVTSVNSYLSSDTHANSVSYTAKLQAPITKSEEQEISSVSEAFSMAMKTLSEFSYDDLSYNSSEYVPTSLSVFQSNLPMPNFHYPSAVQLNQTNPGPKNMATPPSSQSMFVAGPAVPFSEISSTQLKQDSQGVGQPLAVDINATSLHQDEAGATHLQYPLPDGSVANAAALARRGRPKKKKSALVNGESDELSTNGMIVKTDASNNSGKFTCTVCHEIYEGIDNLMQHVESIHLSANPHECCICNKRFAQAGNVKRHIRFVHLRERPFQCRDCDSTFDRLCYLQRHMRSHVDSKVQTSDTSHLNPCNCPECGKKCLTAHHLRGHMQRKHFAKNNEQSEKLVRKYSHLFERPDGFNKSNLDAKPYNEFGQSISPKNRRKRFTKNKMDNGAQQIPVPYTNCHGMYSVHPTSMADYGANATTSTLHDTNFNGNLPSGSISTYSTYQEAGPNSNATLFEQNLSTGNNKQQKSHLEKLLSETSTDNSNFIVSDKRKSLGRLSDENTKAPNSRKSYKLYNISCNFSKLKQRLLRYKCQHCPGRQFSSLGLLKSHIAIVHHSTTRRHLCLLCGHSFSSNLLLMAHVSKRHTNRPKRLMASRKKRAKRMSFENSPHGSGIINSKELPDQCSPDIQQMFNKEQTFQSNMHSVVNLPTHSLVPT
uniref:ZF(C2H2)-38 zinc finger protein 38 n=1 Tax=Phallusia mammillata TaxID=59560 RepID=A0A6F9DQF8_9ASCI|nr:ZF(C2H2)-38 zinc finger protein 38 [Phallusia mammillata]